MEGHRNIPENENIGDGPNAQRTFLQEIQPGPGGDGPADNLELDDGNVHDIIELLRHMYSFRLLCMLIRRNPMRLQIFIDHLAAVDPRLAAHLRENYQALHQLIYEDINTVQQGIREGVPLVQDADLAQRLENEVNSYVENVALRRHIQNMEGNNGISLEEQQSETEQYVFWLINEVTLALTYATGQINEESNPPGVLEDYENIENTLNDVIVRDNEGLVVGEGFEEEHQQFVQEQNNDVEVVWDFAAPDPNVLVALNGSDMDHRSVHSAFNGESNEIETGESDDKDERYFDTSTHNDHNYAVETPSSTTITVEKNLPLEMELSFSGSNTSLPETTSPTETIHETPDNEMLTSTAATANSSYGGVASDVQQFGPFTSYIADANIFQTKTSTNSNAPFDQNYAENLASINETDQASIQRLCGMGFPEDMAIQAYYACHRNEGRAASFLMSYS